MYNRCITGKGAIVMKKIISAFLAVSVLFGTTAFANVIPDHRGTSLDGFEVGTYRLGSAVTQYNSLFQQAGDQYGIDPNILAAVCMQESSGINYSYRDDGTEYPAWGIMQIEYTHERTFAEFGLKREGVAWTLQDRLEPARAIPYAAYLLSESLYRYNYDYAKMLQAYNFGDTVLMRILKAAGDNWLAERKNAISYVDNWSYDSYGDAEYIEHVLRYYHNNIQYNGAKVEINGCLVKFEDQYPIVVNGSTLIPVRAVSETLGADVSWDGANQRVAIVKDGCEIVLNINSDMVTVDGTPYQIAQAPQVINNRTMVPLRFIAEAYNINVDWDGDTRTVVITK